jgi:hypothetical protein
LAAKPGCLLKACAHAIQVYEIRRVVTTDLFADCCQSGAVHYGFNPSRSQFLWNDYPVKKKSLLKRAGLTQ